MGNLSLSVLYKIIPGLGHPGEWVQAGSQPDWSRGHPQVNLGKARLTGELGWAGTRTLAEW